ncbi:hypothetical protein [Nonomuraea sp. LPB2021202275-12-8]|uniref:hypothetical protein n=1 Tax=Nonomuraea sp. LPB2021202275-12-8 TaxID=3120159 RepID=UPI00300D7AEB
MNNVIVAIIIGCEIGFWVLLALGLASRYLWRRRRLSTALLISVPLLDVILLAAAVIDMRGGAMADGRHGLAVAYLAYSVVFGHRTLRWADARFHHRFAGGPPPPRPPAGGMARARYEWVLWLWIAVAYGVAWVLALGLAWLVDDPARTEPLIALVRGADVVVLIALIWPVSYTLWPRKVESVSS